MHTTIVYILLSFFLKAENVTYIHFCNITWKSGCQIHLYPLVTLIK